jgi:hypothetical protein
MPGKHRRGRSTRPHQTNPGSTWESVTIRVSNSGSPEQRHHTDSYRSFDTIHAASSTTAPNLTNRST